MLGSWVEPFWSNTNDLKEETPVESTIHTCGSSQLSCQCYLKTVINDEESFDSQTVDNPSDEYDIDNICDEINDFAIISDNLIPNDFSDDYLPDLVHDNDVNLNISTSIDVLNDDTSLNVTCLEDFISWSNESNEPISTFTISQNNQTLDDSNISHSEVFTNSDSEPISWNTESKWSSENQSMSTFSPSSTVDHYNDTLEENDVNSNTITDMDISWSLNYNITTTCNVKYDKSNISLEKNDDCEEVNWTSHPSTKINTNTASESNTYSNSNIPIVDDVVSWCDVVISKPKTVVNNISYLSTLYISDTDTISWSDFPQITPTITVSTQNTSFSSMIDETNEISWSSPISPKSNSNSKTIMTSRESEPLKTCLCSQTNQLLSWSCLCSHDAPKSNSNSETITNTVIMTSRESEPLKTCLCNQANQLLSWSCLCSHDTGNRNDDVSINNDDQFSPDSQIEPVTEDTNPTSTLKCGEDIDTNWVIYF